MTNESTSASAPATPASLPSIDDVQKMSGVQASAKLTELGAQQDFRNKLFAGDGKAAEAFRQLTEKRSQTEIAESLIAAAADPNAPQPAAGGANNNGMSRRDEVVAAQWHLETGASLEELAEWEGGGPFVGPERYREVERNVRARYLNDPEFVKRYLAGDPQAYLTLDRWHRTKVTSEPWPAIPTVGVVK